MLLSAIMEAVMMVSEVLVFKDGQISSSPPPVACAGTVALLLLLQQQQQQVP